MRSRTSPTLIHRQGRNESSHSLAAFEKKTHRVLGLPCRDMRIGYNPNREVFRRTSHRLCPLWDVNLLGNGLYGSADVQITYNMLDMGEGELRNT